ncbi:hypothetical protein ACFQS6_08915 [Xanthomonas populi]
MPLRIIMNTFLSASPNSGTTAINDSARAIQLSVLVGALVRP